ncbi:FtsK/SpoIIIE domain-containing protein [Nocardioides sp. P5_E3]
MTTSIHELVGTVVGMAAQRMLSAGRGGPRPALRVAGFSHDEVVAAVTWLIASESAASSGLVIKVGARGPIDGLPHAVLLAGNETLTFWRNRDVPAIVLFDWDVQSDQQGLAAITSLDDYGLLNSTESEDVDHVLSDVTRTAWVASGGDGEPPSRLTTVLREVRDAVEPTGLLSLRRWADFVQRTCTKINAADLRTPDEVNRATGASLGALGLFPDSLLFESGAAARARLTKNVNVSGLKQPSGAPITDDDLQERIEGVELPAELLSRLGLAVDEARERLRKVLPGGPAARGIVELQLWLLLFERTAAEQAGLGARVRADLETRDPGRISEYDELEVEPGLNDSDQVAAERLIRTEPLGGATALIDVIAPGLRRRIQKVAFPDAQLAADPLRALLHEIHVLDDGGEHVVELRLEGVEESAAWSRWLFAMLYGRTLSRVRELSEDSRLRLAVAADLVGISRPESDGSEDDFDVAEAWGPLRLAVSMESAGKRRFRWEPLGTPGLIGMGALLSGVQVSPGQRHQLGFDEFFERFQLPRDWDAERSDEARSLGTYATKLANLRAEHLNHWQAGVDGDVLDEYVAAWEPVISEARSALVPMNSPNADLADVVLSDVVQLSGDRLVMLGTHPLRLRWLSRHLKRMTELLSRALSGGLSLNDENPELFFEWLQRISPHGTPPLVVGEDETVAIAVRESAFHEEYTPIKGRAAHGRDWLAAVDDAAVEELVKVVTSYVDTYPHKRDGLVLLLLDRDGTTQLPVRLTRRLRSRLPGVRLELVVLTDRTNHHDVVQAFDREFGDDEMPSGRLFPDVQLVLHHWSADSNVDLSSYVDRIDLALAPALFGTRTTLNAKTRDANAGLAGAFNPWLHRSTHDLQESSQNVVRAMLPAQRDPLLETWSTLCVRHDAHSAVAPQQESNIDYFEMQVRFDQRQKLFVDLHGAAHWVVTLDAFIGRDQIDALEEKPDVIMVRPGVGKNEAYTLIVSSGTGRRFVASRLSRKLIEMGVVEATEATDVAQRLYDVGRNVVPGAVLRALGLGSAANEIVGVVASRFAIEQRFPIASDVPSLAVWLSFDELQDWFGRVQRTRADLGRFVFTVQPDDTVRLDVLVVESKFRQNFDVGAAEQQLDRTLALCRSAFASGDTQSDDRDFWLQELAAAIDRTSAIRLAASELPARAVRDLGRQSLEETILSAVRAGDVMLGDVDGVAVAIAASAEGPAPSEAAFGAHRLVRLHRPELMEIISSIVDERDPAALPLYSAESAASRESSTARMNQLPPADVEPRSVSDVSEPPRPDDRPVHDQRTSNGANDVQPTGLGDDLLRARYERLLDVLDQHNVGVVPAASEPWIEGPGFYVLRVAPKTGVTVDRVVNRVNEIALALQLPTGLSIRTSLDRGNIVFEVPKSPEERYSITASSLWEGNPLEPNRLVVPIGTDIAGETVSIEFSSPDSPHLLVAGTTGSGKSVALETVLRGLCRYPDDSVRLRLVDPKGTELLDFEGDAHLDGDIGVYPQDAIDILESAVDEMESRYQAMRPVRARSLIDYNASVDSELRRPWIVIVLDEYADLTSDPSDKATIEGLLKRLAAKARAAGIHIIAATQRPSADVVSTTIRSNLPAQLALRVKTATDSRIIMDEGGAEALAGQGDAFLRTARGTRRLQVAWSESGRDSTPV